jgi:superfamily II DNA or RNA helicase
MITLFPDQQESIEKLRQAMKRNKYVILRGETGSGKSVMASYMINEALKKGIKSAFVVPRRELLYQMHLTFKEFGIRHGIVASMFDFYKGKDVYVCTSGTLVNKLDYIDPKLVFIDECHFGGNQLERIINHFKERGCWIIGLSASPEKGNGDGLGKYYDELVSGPSIRDLINMKRLSDYRLFAPSSPDLSKIKINNGEYNQTQLNEFMRSERYITGDAIKHYKSHAEGKLNITFCVSIEHSKRTAKDFNDSGIPSIHMDGETPEYDRRKYARMFAEKKFLNICSVDLMTFGYDLSSASGVKDVTIESMSDLRPTQSRVLQRQKNGRVLRYKPYPAIIFDHSNNHKIHGLPCEDIEWSLRGRNKIERESSEKTIPVRMCTQCFFCHKPSDKCPNCGFIYPVIPREIEEVDGELAEIAIAESKKKARQEVGMAKSLDQLIAIGKQRGYKNPSFWAKKVLEGRK